LITTDLPPPSRALAIAAHPDDIEFGAGATLAKWAAAGCEVSLLVCTDGSKGTWDPEADIEGLVRSRQLEQRAAARELGATGEVVFMGRVDGELQSGPNERDEIAAWIRRLQPDVVLGHDPWKRYRLHPDHRHAGWLTIDAIVTARDPHFLPESKLAHHRPDTLLLFEAQDVDHVEGVGDFVGHKLAALEAHKSQLESTMFVSASDDGAELARFREGERARLTEFGALVGGGPCEGFKRIGDL
jgi:LmbE family N-acetylglucosaminyl deacetylase